MGLPTADNRELGSSQGSMSDGPAHSQPAGSRPSVVVVATSQRVSVLAQSIQDQLGLCGVERHRAHTSIVLLDGGTARQAEVAIGARIGFGLPSRRSCGVHSVGGWLSTAAASRRDPRRTRAVPVPEARGAEEGSSKQPGRSSRDRSLLCYSTFTPPRRNSGTAGRGRPQSGQNSRR